MLRSISSLRWEFLPTKCGKRAIILLYLAHEDVVRTLKPDMARLARVDMYALIVTAPGKNCDFVSRFFAPGRGIDEDPVTGSAHCTLIPYWAGGSARRSFMPARYPKGWGTLL